MKKLFKTLLFIFLTSAFVMCSDDDNGPNQEFRVDGKNRPLTQGFYTTSTFGGEGLYLHTISLTNSDLVVVGNNEYEGRGDLVQFSIINESEELEPGKYVIRTESDEVMEASLVSFATDVHMKGSSLSFARIFAGADGTIQISKSGDSFTIKITADPVIGIIQTVYFVVDGKATASYKGELEQITDSAPPARVFNWDPSKF